MAEVSKENKAKAAEAKEAGTVAYKAKQFDDALAKVHTLSLLTLTACGSVVVVLSAKHSCSQVPSPAR